MRNLEGLKLGRGWNKGKKMPYIPRPKAKGRISPNKGNHTRNNPAGEFKKHSFIFWKGTTNEYRNFHKKVTKLFGRPETCEECGRTNLTGKQIHWANKSGEYSFDRNDWLRLCARCHIFFDKALKLLSKIPS